MRRAEHLISTVSHELYVWKTLVKIGCIHSLKAHLFSALYPTVLSHLCGVEKVDQACMITG